MRLHELDFQGHYEDTAERVAERLQLLEPENDLECQFLAWAILPHSETVTEDESQRGYAFVYGVGEYLERGLYRLKIAAEDQSNRVWHAEIAAGVIVTGASIEARQGHEPGFTPFWFISKRLHFKADRRVEDKYPGEAFGHLQFGAAGVLPHNRLFRATV